MIELTRRDALTVAAATGATALGGRFMSLPALAESARDFGTYRYAIGDIRCTAIYDGIWKKDHTKDFVRNASIAETKAALAKGGLSDGFVTIEFSTTLIETADKKILIDPGTGGQWVPTAGAAPKNMKHAGVAPKDIDTILISHFHPDHIFGLMEKSTNAQIYPEAEIIVPEAEYAFWTDPGIFSKLPKDWHGLAQRIQATFPKWQNVKRIGTDAEVAPGIRSLAAPGHTPGHTAYHVSSGDTQLIVAGDVAITPALFVANPGWHVTFDTDPEEAEKTRRRLFDQVTADGIVIAGYHFGFPNAGKILKNGRNYAFQPFLA